MRCREDAVITESVMIKYRGIYRVEGVFMKYLVVDDEEEIKDVRTGGIGSTNKEDK